MESPAMVKSRLPTVIVVVGTALIAASWFWPMLVGGRRAWSAQDAEQLDQARDDVHTLRGRFGALLENTNPSTAKSTRPEPSPATKSTQKQSSKAELSAVTDKLAAAEERHRALTAKLHSAQTGGVAAAGAMRWIGIVAIIIGALGYYSMRSSNSH